MQKDNQMVENTVEEDVNKRDSFGNTPLHQCCYNGHGEVVMRMLQKPNIEIDATNDEGETPLCIAVKENNLYITELLLNAGADANKKDDDGQSLLHMAAKQRKLHMADALIRKGADVNCQNKYGETPLICAVRVQDGTKGSIDITKRLLENGADVNRTNMWGKTALFYAVTAENNRIVEVLLEAGAAG